MAGLLLGMEETEDTMPFAALGDGSLEPRQRLRSCCGDEAVFSAGNVQAIAAAWSSGCPDERDTCKEAKRQSR